MLCTVMEILSQRVLFLDEIIEVSWSKRMQKGREDRGENSIIYYQEFVMVIAKKKEMNSGVRMKR